jgi:hypothetical protein
MMLMIGKVILFPLPLPLECPMACPTTIYGVVEQMVTGMILV